MAHGTLKISCVWQNSFFKLTQAQKLRKLEHLSERSISCQEKLHKRYSNKIKRNIEIL